MAPRRVVGVMLESAKPVLKPAQMVSGEPAPVVFQPNPLNSVTAWTIIAITKLMKRSQHLDNHVRSVAEFAQIPEYSFAQRVVAMLNAMRFQTRPKPFIAMPMAMDSAIRTTHKQAAPPPQAMSKIIRIAMIATPLSSPAPPKSATVRTIIAAGRSMTGAPRCVAAARRAKTVHVVVSQIAAPIVVLVDIVTVIMGIVLRDIVKSSRIELEVVAMIFASPRIAVTVRRMGMRPASIVAARAGSVMARVVVVTLNAIRTVVRGRDPESVNEFASAFADR